MTLLQQHTYAHPCDHARAHKTHIHTHRLKNGKVTFNSKFKILTKESHLLFREIYPLLEDIQIKIETELFRRNINVKGFDLINNEAIYAYQSCNIPAIIASLINEMSRKKHEYVINSKPCITKAILCSRYIDTDRISEILNSSGTQITISADLIHRYSSENIFLPLEFKSYLIYCHVSRFA
jgi:hypothetical protein